MQKVSDLETRISHVTYRGQDGEKHMRYTRNNIVGIVGVAIQERKVSTKEYKAAPTAYIKAFALPWPDLLI
jgi:predicted RNA-binding protein